MECGDASQSLKKPKERSSNVYIPPPARKLTDQEHATVERVVTSRSRTYDETKACNDSSLLFLNDKIPVYPIQNLHRHKQKFRNQHLRQYAAEKSSQQKISEFERKLFCPNSPNNIEVNATYLDESYKTEELGEEGSKLSDTDARLRSYASSCSGSDDDAGDMENGAEINSNEYSLNTENNKGNLENLTNELIAEIVTIEENELITSKKALENADFRPDKEDIVSNLCVEDSTNKIEHALIENPRGKGQNLVDKSNVSEQNSQSTSKQSLAIEESDWEKLYDDSGDCLAGDKIQVNTKEKDKKKVTSDSSEDSEETHSKEETGNTSSIIEIYGFSPDLRTNDLMTLMSAYTTRGLKLSWVDDTHALAIFPSPQLADEVLCSDMPLVRTRPLVQATAASQEKARHLVLPPTLRPKTCPAMARRLVTGALGLKVLISPEARAAEMELLRKAKEEKKLAAKQRDAAWEGFFDTNSNTYVCYRQLNLLQCITRNLRSCASSRWSDKNLAQEAVSQNL